MSSLIQRILYYLSQMLVEQLKPGQKSSTIKRFISILILNEEMFPKDGLLLHRFRFTDMNAGLEWTDLMEVDVLEIPKARRKTTIDSPLDVWLKFLAVDQKEDVMQLAEHDVGVRSACMVLKDLSADEQTRREAEAREKAWRDEMDRLDGAREEGFEQGIGIGELKNRKQTAAILLDAGTPEDVIFKATGFTIDDIMKFRNT